MCVHFGTPRFRRVHSGSRGFTLVLLEVFGSIFLAWVHTGAIGVVGFAWVHSYAPSGRWVHRGSRRFTSAFLKVARFIRIGVCLLG